MTRHLGSGGKGERFGPAPTREGQNKPEVMDDVLLGKTVITTGGEMMENFLT
jgi:hypothetical protein